jgi:hypothetical protein
MLPFHLPRCVAAHRPALNTLPLVAYLVRRIGPIRTATRVVGGVALLVLASTAQAAGLVWALQSHELILGLVLLLAASVAAGLLARHPALGQLQFTGPTGITVKVLIILVLFAVPCTADAAALFYGTSLLLAAWRAQPRCKA